MNEIKPDRKYYDIFCGEVCNLFDRDWDKIQNRVDSGWEFLGHIPEIAWKPMTKLAVDTWENWPRNWVKSVKEIYGLWKNEEKIERAVTDCEYCNGNGYFSGKKKAEVKPGVFMEYCYTFRCSGCRNWFGKLGEKIPANYPFEVKTHGFVLDIYPKPISEEQKQHSLIGILEGIGQRTNPKKPREEFARMRESFVDETPF